MICRCWYLLAISSIFIFNHVKYFCWYGFHKYFIISNHMNMWTKLYFKIVCFWSIYSQRKAWVKIWEYGDSFVMYTKTGQNHLLRVFLSLLWYLFHSLTWLLLFLWSPHGWKLGVMLWTSISIILGVVINNLHCCGDLEVFISVDDQWIAF